MPIMSSAWHWTVVLLLLLLLVGVCSVTAAERGRRFEEVSTGIVLSEAGCVLDLTSGPAERMHRVLVGGVPVLPISGQPPLSYESATVSAIQSVVLKHCPNSVFSRHYHRTAASWNRDDNATSPTATRAEGDDDQQRRSTYDDAVDLLDSRRRSGSLSDSSSCDGSLLLSEVSLSQNSGVLSVLWRWVSYWFRSNDRDDGSAVRRATEFRDEADAVPEKKHPEDGETVMSSLSAWVHQALLSPVAWQALLRWLPTFEYLCDVVTVRQFDLRLTDFPIPAAAFLSGGRRAAVDAVRSQLDVIRFPALVRLNDTQEHPEHSSSSGVDHGVSLSGRAYCDPRGLVLLERQVSASMKRKSNDASSAPFFLSSVLSTGSGEHQRTNADWARMVRSLTSVDVCVPTISGAGAGVGAEGNEKDGTGVASGGVPSFAWMRRLLAAESVVEEATAFEFPKTVAHDALQDERSVAGESRVVTFNFSCSLSRRVVDGPFCVGVVLHRGSESLRGVPSLAVTASSTRALDYPWLATVALFVLVFLCRPLVLRFAWLQLALCTALGVILLTGAVLYFVVKDFQRTRIGKVGLLAILSAGGWVALTDGLASAATLVLLRELHGNLYVQMSVLGAGVVSSIFAHVMLKDMLQRLTSAFLGLVLAALACASWAMNAEGTVILFACALAYATGIARALVVVPYQVMVTMAWMLLWSVHWAFALKRFTGSESDDGEPRDTLPAEAHQEVAYVRPRAAGLAVGRTAEERLKAFEDQGRIYTRRALDDLAARVRADPNKYAKVVRDPHGLARFAGVE